MWGLSFQKQTLVILKRLHSFSLHCELVSVLSVRTKLVLELIRRWMRKLFAIRPFFLMVMIWKYLMFLCRCFSPSKFLFFYYDYQVSKAQWSFGVKVLALKWCCCHGAAFPISSGNNIAVGNFKHVAAYGIKGWKVARQSTWQQQDLKDKTWSPNFCHALLNW